MARIPNHQIDRKLEALSEFENYNSTIRGFHKSSNGHYVVFHWNTMILDYDVANERIEHLASDYISQTTSKLLGRILRALPREAVRAEISQVRDTKRSRQLQRMAGIA